MLSMPPALHAEIVAHALAGLPHEACGLIASTTFGGDSVDRFYPMTNAAASSQIYRIDGAEMMTVEHTADDEGLHIIGVVHSHTHTTAYPSPTDVEDASRFDPFGAWRFVIVSLKHPEPAMRSYRILDGDITEEGIELQAG